MLLRCVFHFDYWAPFRGGGGRDHGKIDEGDFN